MKTFISLLLSIPNAIFGGYVFAHLWNWFVVRKFPGLPTFTSLDALGILFVASFTQLGLFLQRVKSDMIQEKKGTLDASTINVIFPLVTMIWVYPLLLGIGYAWHLVIH